MHRKVRKRDKLLALHLYSPFGVGGQNVTITQIKSYLEKEMGLSGRNEEAISDQLS